jgi:3-hydroxyisobutyrate dehydrogenase-like beta-hydroxyacid dehydrogenase
MRITILGLKDMCSAMAPNLIEAGYEVTLYHGPRQQAANALPAGAQVAYTVAEAVREAQVAITMVADDAAEDALTFYPGGLLNNLPASAIHLCMSSISVEASLRLAGAHEGAGQGYVAAPVLGLPGAAASRRLWIMAAGPDAQVLRCLGILEALGQGITRVGTRPELAHALKLGANALTVAMVETLAEVLAFGEKAGLPPAEYMRILNLGLFRSPLMDAFGGLIVRRDLEPTIQTLDLAAKDLGQLIQGAKDLDVPLPMAGPLMLQLQEARALGLGSRDVTALSMVRRQAAGLVQPIAPGQSGGARPRPRLERRRASVPRKAGEPEKRKAPVAEADPEPPAPGAGPTYSAQSDEGTVLLDLARTTHFERHGNTVWAWVEGKRHATFWRGFPEVEQALGQVLFVRIRREILLNPQSVQSLKPLLWGRARVSVAGGQELTADRNAARRLRFLLN